MSIVSIFFLEIIIDSFLWGLCFAIDLLTFLCYSLGCLISTHGKEPHDGLYPSYVAASIILMACCIDWQVFREGGLPMKQVLVEAVINGLVTIAVTIALFFIHKWLEKFWETFHRHDNEEH